jgi:hypothetical protein
MNGNYDELLQEYDVYKVIIQAQPDISDTQYLVQEATPKLMISENVTQWILDWVIEDKTPEQIRQEKFNPIQFMESLADNLLFQQWASQASLSPAFSFMMIAYQNQKFDRVQSYYNALKQAFPIPDNADIEWQELAQINGIPLTF